MGEIGLFSTQGGIEQFGEASDSFGDALARATPPIRTFTGHVNAATVKDVQFVGPQESHVASGSDCGSFFVWNAEDASLAFVGQHADADVVNCVISHPRDFSLVTCGIEHDFKVWSPINRQHPQCPDTDEAVSRLIRSNSEVEEESSQLEVIERVLVNVRNRPECPLQ